MTQKKTKVLYLNVVNDEYRIKNANRYGGEWVCPSKLHHFFDFPEGQKSIQLCISSEPSDDSYKVVEVNSGFSNRILVGDNRDNNLLTSWAKAQLTRFGFPCYVSLKF